MNDITVIEIVILMLKSIGALCLILIVGSVIIKLIAWFAESVSENPWMWTFMTVFLLACGYYATN